MDFNFVWYMYHLGQDLGWDWRWASYLIKYAHNGWSCDFGILGIPGVNFSVRSFKLGMLRPIFLVRFNLWDECHSNSFWEVYPLWLSDAIWQHGSGPRVVQQVIAFTWTNVDFLSKVAFTRMRATLQKVSMSTKYTEKQVNYISKSLTRITTLILCHLVKSFKDWLPIEFIYSYPNNSTFKWVAVSWQNDRVPVQKFHWWPPGDMSHCFLLIVSYKTKSTWQSMETRASQRNSCIANFCCFNVYSFSSMAQSVRSKYLSEPFNTLGPEHNGSF